LSAEAARWRWRRGGGGPRRRITAVAAFTIVAAAAGIGALASTVGTSAPKGTTADGGFDFRDPQTLAWSLRLADGDGDDNGGAHDTLQDVTCRRQPGSHQRAGADFVCVEAFASLAQRTVRIRVAEGGRSWAAR
jgi:hypothetical protein